MAKFDREALRQAVVEVLGYSITEGQSARLGYTDDDGVKHIEVPASIAPHPNMYYFREATGQAPFVGMALNTGTAPLTANLLIYGMPIRVKPIASNVYVIDGLDGVYAAEYIGTAALHVADNPTRLENFIPGMLDQTEPATMRIRIMAAPYNYEGVVYYHETIESADSLTSLTDTSSATISLPVGSQSKMVMVQRNITTGALTYKQGDSFSSLRAPTFLRAWQWDQTDSSIDLFPQPDTGSILCGYVRLNASTSAVTRTENIWTLQQIYYLGGDGGGGGGTASGDVQVFTNEESCGWANDGGVYTITDVDHEHSLYELITGATFDTWVSAHTIDSMQDGQILILRPGAYLRLYIEGSSGADRFRALKTGRAVWVEPGHAMMIYRDPDGGLNVIGALNEDIDQRNGLTATTLDANDKIPLRDVSETIAGDPNKYISAFHLMDWSVQYSRTPPPMGGRLTTSSGNPVPVTNSSSGTIYYTPYKSARVGLYDTTYSIWKEHTFSELSLSLSGLTASRPHDIFVYLSSGSPALYAVAWSNATTRVTALATQDGEKVRNSNADYRYVGTIYVDSANQCYETLTATPTSSIPARLHVWNHHNRVWRPIKVVDSTAYWDYDTATARYRNNSSYNSVQVMRGLDIDPVKLTFINAALSPDTTGINAMIGFGIDSTTFVTAGMAVHPTSLMVINVSTIGEAKLESLIGAGFQTVYALEQGSGSSATLRWLGQGTSLLSAGLIGGMLA